MANIDRAVEIATHAAFLDYTEIRHPLPAEYEPEAQADGDPDWCKVCGDERAETETEFKGKTVRSCWTCASPEEVQVRAEFEAWCALNPSERELLEIAAASDLRDAITGECEAIIRFIPSTRLGLIEQLRASHVLLDRQGVARA